MAHAATLHSILRPNRCRCRHGCYWQPIGTRHRPIQRHQRRFCAACRLATIHALQITDTQKDDSLRKLFTRVQHAERVLSQKDFVLKGILCRGVCHRGYCRWGFVTRGWSTAGTMDGHTVIIAYLAWWRRHECLAASHNVGGILSDPDPRASGATLHSVRRRIVVRMPVRRCGFLHRRKKSNSAEASEFTMVAKNVTEIGSARWAVWPRSVNDRLAWSVP